MNADTSKNTKLQINYDLLDNYRKCDMQTINLLMDRLLDIFSEEIIWENLHILNKNTDLYRLQQIVKLVRNLTTQSNQEANRMATDE